MDDDTRKLIGGYATGSLSETERRRLFEGALEDQDLFDELAREQALKELLDQPGAKERLLAALGAGKPGIAWWKRPVIWSLAGAAVAIVAAVTWTVTRTPTPAPVAVARISEPSPVLVSPPAAATPAPAPKAAPRVHKKSSAKRAPPVVAQEQIEKKESTAPVTPAAGFLPGAQAVPAAPMRSLAAPMLAPAVPGLVFNYQLHDQTLDLRFLSAGFVSLRFSPSGDTVAAVHVMAGSTRQETIPAGAMEATIVFSAAADTSTGGVSLSRDSSSGRVADPSGTRIELTLQIR